jgi:hypothetical protein
MELTIGVHKKINLWIITHLKIKNKLMIVSHPNNL